MAWRIVTLVAPVFLSFGSCDAALPFDGQMRQKFDRYRIAVAAPA